jgi:hypothetical protein
MAESMQSIARGYKNRKLKKIVGVYQVKFEGFKASGLGDFVRGSVTMMQMIRLFKRYTGVTIEYDVDFRNHPISKYIITNPSLEKPPSYSKLSNLHLNTLLVEPKESDLGYQHLLRIMIEFVNSATEPIIYGFVCRDNVFAEVLETEKNLLRSRMVPTPDMDAYVTSTLREMGITGEFCAIHVRLTDSHSFPPTDVPQSQIDELVAGVKSKISADKQYVLVSNNNLAKDVLQDIPNIHMKRTEICHLGQNETQTDIQTKDTLLDYLILSRSKEIIAFTPYIFTGFSRECSIVYSIPYSYTRLTA